MLSCRISSLSVNVCICVYLSQVDLALSLSVLSQGRFCGLLYIYSAISSGLILVGQNATSTILSPFTPKSLEFSSPDDAILILFIQLAYFLKPLCGIQLFPDYIRILGRIKYDVFFLL